MKKHAAAAVTVLVLASGVAAPASPAQYPSWVCSWFPVLCVR